MPEPKEQKVYAVGLALRNSAIYVQYVRDTPELINKTLHQWDLMTTYQPLTVKETADSAEKADVLNMLEVDRAVDESARD